MLFCALLFSAFSTAQAAHIHRTAGAGKAQVHTPAASSQADDEQTCPLCAAAHAVLPALQTGPVGLVCLVERVVAGMPSEPFREFRHFARLSRPPPAAEQA